MQRKIVWLVVSCLMVLSLVLASCAPAVTEEKEAAPTPEEKEVVTEEGAGREREVKIVEQATTGVEVPKYGGTLSIATEKSGLGFDTAFTHDEDQSVLYDGHLIIGDWAKGPAGTGKYDFSLFGSGVMDSLTGDIAESWEIVDAETLIFHIRPGVHFQNKAPANGREVTATDVVFNLNRTLTEGTTAASLYSYKTWYVSVTAPDRYTVIVKGKETATLKTPQVFQNLVQGFAIYPPESIAKYGDMRDWKNAIGTGPYILTDWVQDSMATYKKNPDYWMTDPVGPGKGNQLPYIDRINWLIVPDASTMQAGMRTGKLDWIRRVTWEDVEGIIKTRPDISYVGQPESGRVIYMDVSKPELPWSNVNVRRALQMAINYQEMTNDFWLGKAALVGGPIGPQKDFAGSYLPLEKLPESIQELFSYNPTKAKKLLADAGYPNGFTMEIITYDRYIEEIQVVKAYWAAIGVTMDIQLKEYAVWSSYNKIGKFSGGFTIHQNAAGIYSFSNWLTGDKSNLSGVSEAYIDDRIGQIWSFENMDKPDVRDKLAQEINLRILDQVYGLELPSANIYFVWQPWLKNYHGEYAIGSKRQNFVAWTWVDQELKKSLGY